jgi:hypothetical protein
MLHPPIAPEESRTRAVVIYRNTLLRDLLVRVLHDGGVSVASTIPQAELVAASLQAVDADVMVFEDAETETFRAMMQAILFGPTPVSVKKVIGLGRGYLVSFVYDKEVVPDADIGDLVARVRLAPIRSTGE